MLAWEANVLVEGGWWSAHCGEEATRGAGFLCSPSVCRAGCSGRQTETSARTHLAVITPGHEARKSSSALQPGVPAVHAALHEDSPVPCPLASATHGCLAYSSVTWGFVQQDTSLTPEHRSLVTSLPPFLSQSFSPISFLLFLLLCLPLSSLPSSPSLCLPLSISDCL